jgi:hypothetical protein
MPSSDTTKQPPASPRNCSKCSGQIRILLVREYTVFYVCDGCGTQGAYFPSSSRN